MKPGRLARTLVHVRPGQAAHRARLRAQRRLLSFGPPSAARWLARGTAPEAAVGWPACFRPVDAMTPDRWPTTAELRAGRIQLLGVVRSLGDPQDWRQCSAPLLWRFHLHYWDWAWGLASGPDNPLSRAVFARLWRAWQGSASLGRGDAWLPYPAALRAWSWCGQHAALVAGSDLEPSFVAELARHAGFLRRHLEHDIGGNHLIKEIKALAGLGVFFADEPLLRLALRRLARQLAVQILPDGGHFERAPAYHCQVLADLVDVAGLLRAVEHPVPADVAGAIARMRRWLGVVLGPDGELPLRGDGYPVSREVLGALRPILPAARPLLMLPDTGLARLASHGWHVLAYVGDPGPPDLAAHAHADTLGCVAYLGGWPLLIDAGTSTYQPGPARDFERSTRAHNTVEVDGLDSTEVWDAFRAGRRARPRDVTARLGESAVICAASHDGYRWLPGRPVHRRQWSLTRDGLRVDDLVTGGGRHAVVTRWHLAPGHELRLRARGAMVVGPAGTLQIAINANGPIKLTADTALAAAGFEVTADSPVLTCRAAADLPVRVSTLWRQVPGKRPSKAARA